MARNCKKVGIRAHQRCRCKKGKKWVFAKNNACGLGTKKRTKTSSKKTCIPGSIKRYGKVSCGCKTKGGGFRILKKSRCK